MRNLILLSILALLLLAGCAKEDKACYQFSTETTTSVNKPVSGYPTIDNSTETICDVTDSEASEHARISSRTSTKTNGGYTYSAKSVTTYHKE